MGRTGWIAMVALWGALMGPSDVAAEASATVTIHVRILDEVGLPANTVQQAQQETSRIFKSAGIALSWLTNEDSPAGTLMIKIVSTPLGSKGKKQNVLGIAPGSRTTRGRIAWLFYPRIADLAEARHVDVSQFLGHVMAHEMGHLLLPFDSHAVIGLMKDSWDAHQTLLASARTLTFEPSQAALIRARLRNSAGAEDKTENGSALASR